MQHAFSGWKRTCALMGIFVIWIMVLWPVCPSWATEPTDEFIKGNATALLACAIQRAFTLFG